MAKPIFMTCRVCGAKYKACKSLHKGDPFNWREVACSPECGTKYFAEVMKSRAANVSSETQVASDKEESADIVMKEVATEAKKSTSKRQ